MEQWTVQKVPMLLLTKAALFLQTQKGVKSRQRSTVRKLLLLQEQEVKEILMVKLKVPAFVSLWAFVLSATKTFLTDAQTGAVKVLTTIEGTVEFLRYLGLLYKTLSIHLKHKKAQKISLDEAILKLETLDNFLKKTVENVMSIFEKPCKPSGATGTVSNQTLSSVRMILDGLRALEELLKELNANYKIDLHTCLTLQVENLHAMGHFKEQFPTLLQYAQNLANTVYESIKRVVQWAAYYYTNDKYYYPVVSQATPLNALPRMSHLKPVRKLKKTRARGDVGMGSKQW